MSGNPSNPKRKKEAPKTFRQKALLIGSYEIPSILQSEMKLSEFRDSRHMSAEDLKRKKNKKLNNFF